MSSQQISPTNDNQNQSDQYSEEDDYQQTSNDQDYYDEDLPNEIVAELDANNQVHQNNNNFNDVDDAVFSDDVQDAFKKYQNEQEELYAQMEECWNYMTQDSHPQKSSSDQSPSSLLNPDATEFKPSWLTSSNNSSTNQFKDSQPKY